jgi:tRNA uridine 5-carboxymethylaminomethyl modification enzyme
LFTSRSEFRLTVRQDNALRRLSEIGKAIGVYDDREKSLIDHRLKSEDDLRSFVDSTNVSPEQAAPFLVAASSASLTQPVRIADLVRRPGINLSDLLGVVDRSQSVAREVVLTTEMEIKYAGYFDRERAQANRMRQMSDFILDSDLPYEDMESLSFEARQKLSAVRPRTLGQAASIPGVSPSDLQNLVIEVERRRVRGFEVSA